MQGSFYKAHRDAIAPLLAALYTAIGQLGRAPPGFLDGVIKPIPKPGGDPKDPKSYRPIQLLNYEYRILALSLIHL